MKVEDILTEVSRAQARRQKEERRQAQLAADEERKRREAEILAKKEAARLEKDRRMLQAKIAPQQPVPPQEPDHPETEFTRMMRELEQQQREQERANQDEIYGVDFMFEPVVDRRTKTKKLYGYWTQHRIQLLNDVQRTGSYRDLGDFKGTTDEIMPLFALFKQLGEQYRQVYILFDRRSMAQFPGLVELHRRLEEARRVTKRSKVPFGYRIDPQTNEIEEIIAWEVVDRRPGELS